MNKLIVDSNIIISALIKSKKIKDLILKEHRLKLYTPSYTYFEIIKSYNKILEYTNLSERDIWIILTKILPKRIEVVGDYVYYDKTPDAIKIAKQFDEKDTPFIALALKLNIPIWTNDKDMVVYGLKSGKYLALDTQAVKDLLKGKSLEDIYKVNFLSERRKRSSSIPSHLK